MKTDKGIGIGKPRDYWTCQYCGTHYDHTDEHCHDPECQKREEQDAEDGRWEDEGNHIRDLQDER